MNAEKRAALLAVFDNALQATAHTIIAIEDPEYTLKVEYTPHDEAML